ncbi:MAG: hypothetical protein ABSD12_00740 [Paraburkholderia sp.]
MSKAQRKLRIRASRSLNHHGILAISPGLQITWWRRRGSVISGLRSAEQSGATNSNIRSGAIRDAMEIKWIQDVRRAPYSVLIIYIYQRAEWKTPGFFHKSW